MIRIQGYDTVPPPDVRKRVIIPQTAELVRKIGDLQHLLYAEGKKSLLVVIQGMDASGKDGAIRNVFNLCNPSGISVNAFKRPSSLEFAHDFLWRVHKTVPPKGQVVIFNRSHYEDILIQRVHKWIDERRVDARIEAINAFEKLLVEDNDTIILKFFMNISFEKQGIKLQERLDDPARYWKHNDGDWKEREHWDEYMRCYEEAINRCNYIPWHIVPVDNRWYRDYFIANVVYNTLAPLEYTLPRPDGA